MRKRTHAHRICTLRQVCVEAGVHVHAGVRDRLRAHGDDLSHRVHEVSNFFLTFFFARFSLQVCYDSAAAVLVVRTYGVLTACHHDVDGVAMHHSLDGATIDKK